MKKLFAIALAIFIWTASFAGAEIRLDYEQMTETELLLVLSEISEQLEKYGYTVTAQKTDGVVAPSEDEDVSRTQEDDYDYPISIEYIGVTNSKGLSTWKDTTISFRNTSDKTIRRVYFGVQCFNRVDELCGGVQMEVTGPFEPNEEFYHRHVFTDVWRDSAAARNVLFDVRVVFMDNTEIVIESEDELEQLFVKVDE